MGKSSAAKQDGDRRGRIAAQRAAQQRAQRRNRLLIAGGAIVAVVAVVLALVLLQGGNSGRTPNHWIQDGRVWYGCNVYCFGSQGRSNGDNPPLWTAFSFDAGTKALSVRQVWSCGESGAAA